MIELLLQAERALGTGAYDVAERLYWQAIDADSQNAIAIVGLAKVARLKGDDRTAITFGRRALKVDAENAVARKLVAELEAAHPEARPAAPAEPVAEHVAEAAAVATSPAAPAPGEAGQPAAEPAAPDPMSPKAPTGEPAVAAPTPSPAAPAVAEAPTPPAGDLPADPGVRPPRSGRPDLDWPAADLQQVRPPRDK